MAKSLFKEGLKQTVQKAKEEEKVIAGENELNTKEEFFARFDLFQAKDINAEELSIFEHNGFYPVTDKIDGAVCILTNNPDLRKELGKSKDKKPLKLLTRYASSPKNIFSMSHSLYFEIVDQTSVIDKEYTDDEAKEFFHDLLTDASRKNASDIHISWLSDSIAIKYRIDGKIVQQPKKISKELGHALRNIFVNKSGESEYEENEVAGQIAEIIDGVKKEYRLSIGPTVHGYVIVIRMESHISKNTNLPKWGYSPRAVELIRRLFSAHHGIILVTGATGSGKSTLLYTCIIEMINKDPQYSPEILTVEDPVEIIVDGVNQIQVNTKGDPANWITFSKAIKMFLRQDPDMIVVGEIRDNEVAIQAVTAAKTGHLTASTLHTNDVKSTFSRLRELGIDNANIEDGVKGVISQKLLNRLCNSCKVEVQKNGQTYFERNKEGCSECKGSTIPGMKGRVPIVEIAELNNNAENYKPENFENYYSLDENIIYLLEEGIIDIEEAQRFINYGEQDNLSKRKEIINIWNHATKSSDSGESYIFPLYQPVIDDKDYVIGLEAFMRIRNEDGEIMSPKYFMELVKKMDMYQKFSMYMLEKLIADSKKMEKKIFWNIDEENIMDENFGQAVLDKLIENDLLDRFVLEFEFKPAYKKFIEFCNKNKIAISFDHFEANMKNVVFIERNEIKADFVKTNKDFVEGIHKKEKWVEDYINIIIHNDSQVIVNFVETEGMLNEVSKEYKKTVYGYQGYGIRRPDHIDAYIES
jgi:type IV pilus assembly protein PilB